MTDYNAILKRMDIMNSGCQFYRDTKSCADCPSENKSFCWLKKFTQSKADINGILKLLDDWAAANPVKTYAQDFFEKFPEAPKDPRGVPRCCPFDCGYSVSDDCINDKGMNSDCVACWNRPMPDAQQDC